MNTRFSSIMPITNRPETRFVEGKGVWLMDEMGRRYLDFMQGWAVNTLGHSPKVVVDAIAEQAGRLMNIGPAFYNEPMVALADQITAHSGLDEVFFANSGAEANEGAIKLARKWGTKQKNGAFEIVTMQNGFHGRTLATMSASGKPQFELLFEPKVPGFIKVPFNDIGAVEAVIGEQTVAVMLELIQGEAGVIPADLDFVQQLRELTSTNNCLLTLTAMDSEAKAVSPR
ncbi:hypothetical protein BOW53_15700 [Solemya pervernicosa gill symbiont]|uniref:Acetylornithine transaminase n=1 Tax=Solemya pervernicosa gill symbiont TaxID=642797 RepID=A0A1T2KZW5_9GAMM|nr:hypothetical protein BOW53_15700 [Solemya pervernicosa gill symbiont]